MPSARFSALSCRRRLIAGRTAPIPSAATTANAITSRMTLLPEATPTRAAANAPPASMINTKSSVNSSATARRTPAITHRTGSTPKSWHVVSTPRDPRAPRFLRRTAGRGDRPPPYADPVVLALSTVKQVEELVTRAQTAGRAPALIAGVIRGGTLAYVTRAGEHPAADRDTQFRIGSITKSLTAALILGLR